MTLSKQLTLLISALFLAIFGVNYAISINNMRSYLQIEAQVHVQDTATSLGLSLSPHMRNKSDPILKTMIGAIFDMGYYKEIKLVDVDNKPLVTMTNEKIFEEVPSWFINVFPMLTATAESDISSGWNISGTVYVTANPGYAYLKLYEQAKNAFIYSLTAFFISICLLLFVLRFTLKPLGTINKLALSIAEGHFDQISVLPWTTEVKNVAHSMNIMSRRLGGVMDNLKEKLNELGQKLQLDGLTGLYNKSTFDADIKQFYLESSEGYLYLIKTDSLSVLIKERGSEAIDVFLQSCAANLQKAARNFSEEIRAYHFYGAEFALLARNIDDAQANQLANSLSAALSEIGYEHGRNDIGHIGVVEIDLLSTPEATLPAAYEAYEQAVLIGPNGYYVRTGEDRAKDIAEWKSLVFDVVDRDAYQIQLLSPIVSFTDNRILMEEAFVRALDKLGMPLPAGIFVSMAEKYEKIVTLERGVVEKALERLNDDSFSLSIAINLSTRTVKNGDFREWFVGRMKPLGVKSKRLILSFSAYAVAKDFNVYHEFVKFLRAFGIRVVIKRFDGHTLSLEKLKKLQPDFVRLSRELSNGLQGDDEKISYLRTVKEIGDLLDIAILGENIQSETDFAVAQRIGLAGASR